MLIVFLYCQLLLWEIKRLKNYVKLEMMLCLTQLLSFVLECVDDLLQQTNLFSLKVGSSAEGTQVDASNLPHTRLDFLQPEKIKYDFHTFLSWSSSCSALFQTLIQPSPLCPAFDCQKLETYSWLSLVTGRYINL